MPAKQIYHQNGTESDLSQETLSSTSLSKLNPLEVLDQRVDQSKLDLKNEITAEVLSEAQAAFENFKSNIRSTVQADTIQAIFDMYQLDYSLYKAAENTRNLTFNSSSTDSNDDIKVTIKDTKSILKFAQLLQAHPIGNEYYEDVNSFALPPTLRKTVSQVRDKIKKRLNRHVARPLYELKNQLMEIQQAAQNATIKSDTPVLNDIDSAIETIEDSVTRTSSGSVQMILPLSIGLAQTLQLLYYVSKYNWPDEQFVEPSVENLPENLAREIERQYTRSVETVEQQYRSSLEARSLRLLHLVQTPDSIDSTMNKKRLQALIRQLKDAGADNVCDTLTNFNGMLTVDNADLEAIRQLLVETDDDQEVTDDSDSEQAPTTPDEPDLDDTPSSASNNTDPEEELIFKELVLEDMGIKEQAAVTAMLEKYSLDDLYGFQAAFKDRDINQEVQAALHNSAPSMLLNMSLPALVRHLKTLNSITVLAPEYEDYKIFNPLEYPEHFTNPDVIERTRTALECLRAIHEEVEAPVVSEVGNGTTEALHPEQELIDQLANYVSHPGIAYGLIRYGLCYDGKYRYKGTPKGMRKRTLKSIFQKQPTLKAISTTEKELARAGFIVNCIADTRKSDNLIKLVPASSIEDKDKQSLQAALTDIKTKPNEGHKIAID